MNKKLHIEGVMTAFPHSIGIDQNLSLAKKMMREHGVRHLPVQDGGKLVGILSHRDINFALALDKKEPEEVIVEDAFTVEPYIVNRDADLSMVASHMAQNRLGCALVIDGEKLVGIFTATDACRTLAALLRNEI
ncbi:MAG: CBS domain-containing protein [Bdellovibrionales bacterium]|nr:CBS domain-containing protein [Bdellovibrionales bacterium]